MRSRRRTGIAACAATALAAGGIYAAIGIGEAGNGGHALEVGREGAPIVATHPMPASQGQFAGARSAGRKARKPKVIYRETQPLPVDTSTAVTLRCPKGTKAINGTLVTEHPGEVLDYSAPSGFTGSFRPRLWSLEVIYAQTNNTTHDVQLGVVCLRGVR
jgi:hypothetical protein